MPVVPCGSIAVESDVNGRYGMLESLAERAGSASREDKWRLYERVFPARKGERILDIGASHWVNVPRENWFLQRYPYPEQVTAVVLSQGDAVAAAFPGVHVVEADGRDLPFRDREFDVVHSNAVVEHVGPRDEQKRFVAELTRVAASGFVTTPNRWFPIESHSRLPVVHWLPLPIAWRVARVCHYQDEGAWLLGPRGFLSLFGETGTTPTLYRQRMAGVTATLIATFDTTQAAATRPAG
jgi:hypothetical protein